MKKITVILIAFSIGFIQKTFAQDAIQSSTSLLLDSYYGIKNSLVKGNAQAASDSAEEFIRILNGIDYKVISEGNVNILLKDATVISESKDISEQRKVFENFSNNMTELAKVIDLSDDTIYQMYCPMKDAYWLSDEKEIKNPYFGNTMLTCGKVVDTIEK